VVDSLVIPKQVEQQSTEPGTLQPLGHEAVAGAQAAAAAPMGKEDKAATVLGADQGSAEAKRRNRDLDLRPTTAMAQGFGRVLMLCHIGLPTLSGRGLSRWASKGRFRVRDGAARTR